MAHDCHGQPHVSRTPVPLTVRPLKSLTNLQPAISLELEPLSRAVLEALLPGGEGFLLINSFWRNTRMIYRLCFSFLIAVSMVVPVGAQTVVRFETTVGDFDMVLNPTNNPALIEYAGNMLNYVATNRYLGSWINRADTNPNGDGFVLQMGGFFSLTKRPPPTIDSIRNVNTLAPVAGHPAAETGLSNTIGTVSLALPGNGAGGTDRDAGTSSFFVNLGDNSFLDADFTVFAAISDMTTINKIMGLTKVDRTTDTNFGAGSGNLAFTDVPVEDNNFQVFIKRAFVVTDTLAATKAIAAVSPIVSTSAAASAVGSETPFMGGGSSLVSSAVPEPSSVILTLVFSSLALLWRCRR